MAGCGGASGPDVELHPVTGEIVLDGKPLADARVTYTPKSGGKSASAMTDAAGKYVLDYMEGNSGVPAADYSVSVSTYRAGELADGETGPPPSPEKIPVTYNKKTTLSAKVPGEPATFRFELKASAGAISQPDVARGMN